MSREEPPDLKQTLMIPAKTRRWALPSLQIAPLPSAADALHDSIQLIEPPGECRTAVGHAEDHASSSPQA